MLLIIKKKMIIPLEIHTLFYTLSRGLALAKKIRHHISFEEKMNGPRAEKHLHRTELRFFLPHLLPPKDLPRCVMWLAVKIVKKWKKKYLWMCGYITF